jgi:putative membrane protein
MKRLLWIVLVILGLLVLLLAFAGTNLLGIWGPRQWWMMGPGMMHNRGFGILGWLGMFLVWLIPIGLVVLAVLGVIGLLRRPGAEPDQTPLDQAAPRSPQEILKSRYAKGELTREEYFQMRDDLS